MRARSIVLLGALVVSIAPVGARAKAPSIAQDRSVEPVVLTGAQFAAWSAGKDPTLREPSAPHNYGTADIEASLPGPLRSECYQGKAPAPGQGYNPYDDSDNGDHNCYQSSRLPRNPLQGAPVNRLLGYRWDGDGFERIPFQVDERFTRYLTNNYSGFAFYSGTDHHNGYAYDREGFRYTWDPTLPSRTRSYPGQECVATPRPGSTIAPATYHPSDSYATTPDPVAGLDDDDELVFMWSDAGAAPAPPGTALPAGMASSFEVAVADPSNPTAVAYAYVMLAADETDGGPSQASIDQWNIDNAYVRYERDPGVVGGDGRYVVPPADMYAYSQSSYRDYGFTSKGAYCEPDGTVSTTFRRTADKPASPPDLYGRAIEQRRPLDTAWVRTPRYWFRYDGRWLMTQLRISSNDSGLSATSPDAVGPDIIDQWKARAFQQRPGGETPCCGYEEEVNNWGGSSILMGERWGPVRVIRSAWGADSSTNNVKTEIFYRDEIRFGDALRVHVIPPLDGIYVQWDYNAGVMVEGNDVVGRYYNPLVSNGAPIDGRNDEVFGNTYIHAEDDRIEVRDDDPIPVVGPQRVEAEVPGGPRDGRCEFFGESGVCNDIDLADPTFSGPAGNLNWEQISTKGGSVVTRWTIKEHNAGDSYSVIAQPYYRDDSCFDDGTGSDPGPHLRSRGVDDGAFAKWTRPSDGMVFDRECWDPGEPLTGDPAWDRRYWQGDIATHGLHLQFIADSDNAATTLPINEIVSEQRMVVLPGLQPNVGETYGRGTSEYPLLALTRPFV